MADRKKIVVDFIKNNPEVAKGYDKGKVTAKVLADSEERFGVTTPRSALIKAFNAAISFFESDESKRGRRAATKVGKIKSDREERLLDTPKKKASGGSVKNYAYGGRVAAMSAEKS